MTTPLNSARTIGQSNFLVGYFYVVVICWWSLGQKSCVQLGKVHSRKVGLVWLRWASWRLGKGDPPQRSWQTRSLSRRRRSCPWKNQIKTKHGDKAACNRKMLWTRLWTFKNESYPLLKWQNNVHSSTWTPWWRWWARQSPGRGSPGTSCPGSSDSISSPPEFDHTCIAMSLDRMFKILKNGFDQAELCPLGIPLSWEARSCWPRSPPAPCCRAQWSWGINSNLNDPKRSKNVTVKVRNCVSL